MYCKSTRCRRKICTNSRSNPTYTVCRGDIISSVFFTLALDQLVQTIDKTGTGLKCDILNIRVLGYVDDAELSLVEPTVAGDNDKKTH